MLVRHPIWLKRVAAPSAEAFALLYAIESLARALLVTVVPLDALALLGSAQRVSLLYAMVGLTALAGSLTVPVLIRLSARRWVYSAGALLVVAAGLLLAAGGLGGQIVGLMARAFGVVCLTICTSLYILDHLPRREYSQAEPKRMFYSAGAWTLGPAVGVTLSQAVGPWAPYLASSAIAVGLLVYFWMLRLGERPDLFRSGSPVPHPLDEVRHFLGRPRLVMAWTINMARIAWWTVFFVYTPILAIHGGLGGFAGAAAVSLGTGFIFLMPVWAPRLRRLGIRATLRIGLTTAGLATAAVAGLAQPWLGVGLMVLAALAMSSIDAVGNLPFMLAVHAHERARMTAVYSTYRDFGELVPPAGLAAVLLIAPLGAAFLVGGGICLATALLVRRLHPRLGLAPN